MKFDRDLSNEMKFIDIFQQTWNQMNRKKYEMKLRTNTDTKKQLNNSKKFEHKKKTKREVISIDVCK